MQVATVKTFMKPGIEKTEGWVYNELKIASLSLSGESYDSGVIWYASETPLKY